MSYNVDTYPKTVNLESSLPVNSHMKRVVTSKCPNGPNPKCLKKSYNIPNGPNKCRNKNCHIPIAGSGSGGQANNWPTLDGYKCVGHIQATPSNPHILYCVTKYTGISMNANGGGIPGQCQISPNATAQGVWINNQNPNNIIRGNMKNWDSIQHFGACPSGTCSIFQCPMMINGTLHLGVTFTALC